MSAVRVLFLYGTLLDPEILSLALGQGGRAVNASRLAPAVLPGYRRGYIVGRDFPGLAPEAGAETAGMVLCGVTRVEAMRLNRYEGPHYRLASVETHLVDGGGVLAAQAYVLKPGQRLGADWDLDSWQYFHKPDYMSRWFG